MTPNYQLDLDLLLKLRLVVARIGEMDIGGWWNTKGQLGPVGTAALRRGFPRTHHFAAARSVFAVAAHRCREVFDPPKSVTLWQLPEALEEEFDARWEHWLDHAVEWDDFFKALERPEKTDLAEAMLQRGLVAASDVEDFIRLKRSAEGKAVPLGGPFRGASADVIRLALAFGRSERGALAVPYMRRDDS
jgi:hypothetical protein